MVTIAVPHVYVSPWIETLRLVIENRERVVVPGSTSLGSSPGAWAEVAARLGENFLARWMNTPLNSAQQRIAVELVRSLVGEARIYDSFGGKPRDVESQEHVAWRKMLVDLADQISKVDGAPPPATTADAVRLRLVLALARTDLAPATRDLLRLLSVPTEPPYYIASFYAKGSTDVGHQSIAFHAALDAVDLFFRSLLEK